MHPFVLFDFCMTDFVILEAMQHWGSLSYAASPAFASCIHSLNKATCSNVLMHPDDGGYFRRHQPIMGLLIGFNEALAEMESHHQAQWKLAGQLPAQHCPPMH